MVPRRPIPQPKLIILEPISRTLFKLSKPIHKYVGLVALLYFLLMGISGVLLNHPSLIRSFSIPLTWMPAGYHYVDWNRMALRDAVFSSTQPGTVYVGGKSGVWQSRDNGKSFTHLSNGFPISAYDRDTRCLLLTESGRSPQLYAGTRAGLYRYDFAKAAWIAVQGPVSHPMEIVDLVRAGDRILVFAPSACYALGGTEETQALEPVPLRSNAAPLSRVPLFRFFLKLHDGSVLGLPGKLFMDMVGLTLVFLSISAIYIVYIPWRKKRFGKGRRPVRYFRFFHKYHLKLGIYTGAFIAIIALTGMFVRPPLLMAIVRYSVPAVLLNNTETDGQWQTDITRAVYEPQSDTLLLATRDGFFRGPTTGSQPFSKVAIDVPVHGMGVFVMERLSRQRLLIGSFSGLYVWDSGQHQAVDLEGRPLQRRRGGRPRTTQTGMAAGAIVHNGQLNCWVDYRRGLRPMPGGHSCFAMPDQVLQSSRMSLWHVLFEIHNGRFFRDWLGAYTWLLVPVGGLVLVINVLTGCYDWLYRRRWLRF